MPRRRWLPIIALGGLLAGIAADGVLGQEQQATQQAAKPSGEQENSAHPQLPSIAEAPKKSPCEHNPLDDKTGPESDICQQWRMAEFAGQQARTVASQYVVNAVEAGALVITVFFSIFATIAAVRAARAAEHSVSETRRIGEAQVRAYLSVYPGMHSEDGKSVEILLKNSGQSPARNVRHIAATSKLIWPIEKRPALLVPKDDQVIPTITIWPGGETSISADWADRDDELAGEHLCSYGIIYYEDVFKKRYRLKFLARWGVTEVVNERGTTGKQFSWLFAPVHNGEECENEHEAAKPSIWAAFQDRLLREITRS